MSRIIVRSETFQTTLVYMNFFRFLSILRIFFFLLVFEKGFKVTKFGYVLAKRLRTTIKKFLDNR